MEGGVLKSYQAVSISKERISYPVRTPFLSTSLRLVTVGLGEGQGGFPSFGGVRRDF